MAAFFLVTATFTPAVAIDTVDAAGNESAAGNMPRALKAQAVEDTDALDAPKRRHESARDRAHDRFNESRQHYRGPIRASSSKLFNHDAIGVQALTAFAGTDAEADAVDVADQVLRIDNESAYQEILDARRLLNESRDEIDNNGIVRSMEAHLRNAERTYDRTERTMGRAEDADGRRAIRLRASSIRQLRQSWRQAHFVVERAVERTNATLPVGSVDSGDDNETDAPGEGNGTAPEFNGSVAVSLLTDSDPIRDENGTMNRTILVNISANGPVALDSARVSVDGNQRVERNLSGLVVTANRSLPIGLRVPLAEGGHRVTVTALGNDGATTANATVRLDGDGLNESMEARLGTDPLDPDSNSTETGTDESNDGVIDGREDFDSDGLPTLSEFEVGTDPLTADTDSDGLRDGIEELFLTTDPLNADTDDDGVLDGAEDPDEDTLNNSEEIEAGSSPYLADTDRDQLRDPAELEAGTNVTNPDTDGDGLLDGVEGAGPFDTDPLDEDTDNDGILDGNETYTTTARNETLGATAEITGEGDVAGGTTIEAPKNARYDEGFAPNATVAPFVSFESETNFSEATITIQYDESRVDGAEQNLSIYRFNESRHGYEPVNTTVNTTANTATAETSHFSVYTVFENEAWVEYVKKGGTLLGKGNIERYTNYTFESTPSSITENGWSCRRTSTYPTTGPDGDQLLGDCTFDSDKNTVSVFEQSRNWRYLNRTISLPDEKPLYLKTKVEGKTGEVSSDVRVTLFGVDSSTNVFYLRSAERSRQETATRRLNITSYAGQDVTISARARSQGEGEYRDRVNSTLDIHFIDIEAPSNATVTTDTDGDGIPDFREVLGVPLANGEVVTLDPQDSDTDGDGIPDGEEVDLSARATQVLPGGETIEQGYLWSSHLNQTDTDGDGISDGTEQNGWTVRTINRSGSAYQWAPPERESNGTIHVSSDPKSTDSDWDGLSDQTERQVTHTDPSGDVAYDIAGKIDTVVASRWIENSVSRDDLLLEKYYSDDDDDQDGIIDVLEDDFGVPVRTEDGFDRLSLDGSDPDVDGDGLVDGEELESELKYRGSWTTYVEYPMVSHPRKSDSDQDQLSDLEEQIIGTDPLSDDSDGDGLTDSFDHRPTVDDTPPEITFLRTTKIGGELQIVDNSKVKREGVEVNPYFEGEGWRPDLPTVIWTRQAGKERPEYPDRYSYDFGGKKGPNKYWVNVTDVNDTSVNYLINRSKAGPSALSNVSIEYGKKALWAGARSKNIWVATGGGVLLSVGYGLENRMVVDISQPGESNQDLPIGFSDVVKRYNDTEFGDLVLPRGTYSEQSGVETGRGWEFIDATDDDVTLENIGRALDPENAVGVTLPRDDSDATIRAGVGIAGPVDDPELVFVVFVGDTILRATAQDLKGIDSQGELDTAREFLHDDASETTKRVMTDGGLEDEQHPSALVEALDDPNVTESDVDDAVETIEALNQEEMAWDVVEEAPAPAVEFFAEIQSNNVEAMLGQAQSAQQVADFLDATDNDAAELIQRIDDRGLYSTLLELKSENQRGVANIAIHGEIDGRSQYIDKVDADPLIEIAQNYESGDYDSQDVPGTSKFLDLVVIAESPVGDGRPVFMDADDITHAIDRHVNGDSMKNKANTTFFPVGGEIGTTGVSEGQLPDRMPSEAGSIDRTRVKKIPYEAIRNGKQDTIGDSVTYPLNQYGIQEVVINVEFRGHGQSIYPSYGDSVRRWSEWAGGEWQRWNGNKWITWSNHSP